MSEPDPTPGAGTRPEGRRDLVVVMPVHDERWGIRDVIVKWRAVLEATVPDVRMLVLDDGSRDGTAEILDGLADPPAVTVIHKPNEGHGPTILEGYRRAVGEAEWVFQVDSDDEIPPSCFPAVWAARKSHDFVLGARAGRKQGPGRRAVSAVSNLAVRLLFGPGVEDANTPCRLMRAELLAPILREIPDGTFAPNVVISGLAARRDHRIRNLPVPHRPRGGGAGSLGGLGLWTSAARALTETVRAARRSRP